MMIVLQLVLFCLLFTLMVRLSAIGGGINALYFYPKPVQEKAFSLGLADEKSVKRKRLLFMIPFLLILLCALLLIIGLWNGVRDFWTRDRHRQAMGRSQQAVADTRMFRRPLCADMEADTDQTRDTDRDLDHIGVRGRGADCFNLLGGI